MHNVMISRLVEWNEWNRGLKIEIMAGHAGCVQYQIFLQNTRQQWAMIIGIHRRTSSYLAWI